MSDDYLQRDHTPTRAPTPRKQRSGPPKPEQADRRAARKFTERGGMTAGFEPSDDPRARTP